MCIGSALEALQRADSSRDSVPSCPAEDIFLCKLLKSNSIGKDGSEEIVIDALHVKHKEYDDMIQSYSHSHSVDQSEIKRIAVYFKENWSGKLPDVQPPVPFAVNGSVSPEITVDKTMGLRDLKASIEEAKSNSFSKSSTIENNELEIRMEEAERKDIKAEFQVMASALSKEMEMMKSQLNRWKDTASEAVSLKEEAQQSEHKDLVDNCSEQSAEIKSLQAHVNAAVESLKSRIVQSEEQMNACVTHALKSTEEDRHLPVNLENSKSELSNADKELKCLKSLLS
ncbi:hypothetical protein Tco_1198900 [Tanacetum coccineum]